MQARVTLRRGDCLKVLARLSADSLESCVTDPPYHLTANKKGGSGIQSINLESPYGRARIGTGNGAGGFMGKAWDGGNIAFKPDTWAEVYRVLKPGAYLLAFGGTRTYHRMACAIEDAGFEIRDTIMWVYGSGFPKSRDVSKGIDNAAGARRRVVGKYKARGFSDVSPTRDGRNQWAAGVVSDKEGSRTVPATAAARQWEGWGTALKPACEPIVLARKPLSEGTVAANVLKWGTGAINVDGCRVEGKAQSFHNGSGKHSNSFGGGTKASHYRGEWKPTKEGRWPANVIHDGSEEVLAGFPDVGKSTGGRIGNAKGAFSGLGDTGFTTEHHKGDPGFGDAGSAARFFYCAKANKKERNGSKHPTIKPVALLRYLVRLVTPPGGTVLDPFAGTGTTGQAARLEGLRAILIEREAEYQADIRKRLGMKHAKISRRRAA